MAYRAFFALPVENFSTTTGQSTNAVYGFTSMLIRLLADEKPSHVVVAFDVSRRSFRTDEYPEYKATRSASPPEFSGQVDLIREVLDAIGITHISKDGFEADDLIATLATAAEAEGMDVLICSGDRDALQLVSNKTTVLYPMRGVSELARMTPEAVEDKYLVAPDRYPELAALVGETSDNLPGVPGVGPKTAAKWLDAYDGLENLLERIEEVGGKAGQSLRDHVTDVLRNRRLNQLVRDVEIEIGPKDASLVDSVDPNRIADLFGSLEFRTMTDRLYEVIPPDGVEVVSTRTDLPPTARIEPGQLSEWLGANTADLWALRFDGESGRGTGRLHAFAIASEGALAWCDLGSLTPADDEAFEAWLADESITKVIHDAKGAILAAAAHGWRIAGVGLDTMVAAYLVRPDTRARDFDSVVFDFLGREITVGGQTSGQLMLDDSQNADVLAAGAHALLELGNVLTSALEEISETELLRDIEMPLIPVLARMEQIGIAIDEQCLADLEDEFAAAAKEAAQAAHDVIGREINLGSPKQLQAVLFDELDMPKTKKTKTGWTTDADALRQLLEKTGHPFLEHLLVHRDVNKLRQTVESLRKTICDDGKVHTTFSQVTAATGRLSSNDPNVQNIPIRTSAGRRIREAFIPSESHDLLLTADYSQIEMRIMAHMSGEAELIEAFRAGDDFHTIMAARVFDADPDAISIDQRARIKAMNYGLAYGLSAYGLSQQLAITPGEAQGLMDVYFGHFGGVQDYLQSLVDEARKNGFTETLWGRRRFLPDLHSDNRQRRQMAERMALNAPIQGTAADIIKIAMIRVDRELRERQMQSRLLLQVHDELVLEVTNDEREAAEQLLVETMSGAAELSVPLEVSVGVGRNWFEAGH